MERDRCAELEEANLQEFEVAVFVEQEKESEDV
jgi:hypothetical protein